MVLRMLAWCLFTYGGALLAGNKQTTTQAHSTATMFADRDAVVPGETIRIGLHIVLEDHWHAYWENPGDSGSAPILDFHLPQGFAASPLIYPRPKRFAVGPLTSFGYEGEVLLFREVRVPTHLSLDELVVRISAEWLVCKEECIPAFYDFERSFAKVAVASGMPISLKFDDVQGSMDRRRTLRTDFYRRSDRIVVGLAGVHPQPTAQLLDLFPYPGVPVANDKPRVDIDTRTAWLNPLPQTPGQLDTIKMLSFWKHDTGRIEAIPLLASFEQDSGSLWMMLIFALLGGLILNLMPCVFPVLALKIFGLAAKPQKARLRIADHIAYLLGILVSMWVLGLGIYLLKLGGETVGWGFQMQSPGFVAGMALLFLVMALSFQGVVEFSGQWTNIGHHLTRKTGWVGVFFSGVLAVVVASPCTAPFMGIAMGYAISQPLWINLLVLTALGLGLGLPYLVFSALPQAGRLLPRPGAWMVLFKEWMAFPLLATSIWLVHVHHQLTDAMATTWLLSAALAIFLILWSSKRLVGLTRSMTVGIGITATLATTYLAATSGPTSIHAQDHTWIPYSESGVEKHRQQQPVFVNFTASWCITCKVNEMTTFDIDEVRQFVRDHGIVMMEADWTQRDPVIAKTLQRYDRAGVPLYLLFVPGQDSPVVLPEIMTPATFKSRISAALEP